MRLPHINDNVTLKIHTYDNVVQKCASVGMHRTQSIDTGCHEKNY